MAATKLAYTTRWHGPHQHPPDHAELRRGPAGRGVHPPWDGLGRAHHAQAGRIPRQNQIARALHVMGRLEKTLFILELLLDPQLRRRDGRGLNDRRPDGQTLDEVEVCHRFSHSDAGADAREASRRPRDQPTSTTSKPTSSPTGRCSQAATAMIAAPASRTAIMAGVMWRLI